MRIAALLAAAVLAAAAPANGQEPGVRLTVLVTGADASTGQIKAGLYYGEANFTEAMASRGASDPLRSATAAADAAGQAALVFDDLAVGEYALTVHYDRDGDGVMNTGLFGIPSEKIGFSNNAPLGLFGPPSWADVRFSVGAEGTDITIALKQAEQN